MTKTTVAMITPLNRKGGIATYASKLIDVLPDSRVQVVSIPIENTNSANPLSFVELISSIPDDADVVHIQFEAGLFGRLGMSGVGAPAFFAALGTVSTPVVTTLHEVHRDHAHRGRVGDWLLRWRDWFIERLAAHTSDVIVVHTREAEQVVRRRHRAGSVERMLHPVEDDADPLPKQAAKESIGVDGPMVLTFGWVEAKKQYVDVVELLPSFPSLTYVIAGGKRSGEGEGVLDSVFECAEEFGVRDQIDYVGYLEEEEIATTFSAADAVIVPYDRVSQSGVVNDALAYRRPVIASALPAFEELRDEYACLLTYEDQSELRKHLKAVLCDDEVEQRLTERIDRYTVEESWERFGERTVDLYERILPPN